MNFEQYPFEKLTKLLENITPNEKYKIIQIIGMITIDNLNFSSISKGWFSMIRFLKKLNRDQAKVAETQSDNK